MSEHHDLNLFTAGRRYWAACSCGWRSGDYDNAIGPTLAFGDHLCAEPASVLSGQPEADR